MKTVVLVRAAKIVALLGFLLPWVTVSCSGQKIASASGLALATGRMTVADPMSGAAQSHSGSPLLWITLALIATAVGLFFAFRRADKSNARIMMIAAGTAVAGVLFGLMSLQGSLRQAATKSQGSFDASMAAMFRIDTQFGVWLTLLALIVAGVGAWMLWSGRESLSEAGAGGGLGEGLGKALAGGLMGGGSGGDAAFWDGMSDKNDPDQLQEYLLRHPSGQFHQLARAKLARLGVTPLTDAPAAAEPPAAPPAPLTETPAPTEAAAEAAPQATPEAAPATKTCSACGASAAPGDAFCTQCGQPLTTSQ